MACTPYLLGFGPIPLGNIPAGSFPQFYMCDAEIDRPATCCAGSMAFCALEATNWIAKASNIWTQAPSKRVETFSGTSDASGNYSVTYAPAYAITPHVNPVCFPSADSVTRVRVTSASNSGFTVKTEKNATVNLLGIDILGIGTANVVSVPLRVLVVES